MCVGEIGDGGKNSGFEDGGNDGCGFDCRSLVFLWLSKDVVYC